jgi:hypothetical protein
MDAFSQQARERLQRLAAARKRFGLAARCLLLGATLLALILLIATMDYKWPLPRTVRVCFFLIAVLAALYVIFKALILFRRAGGLKKAALDIETAQPELGCVVSTASEYLEGERTPRQTYEPELVRALEAQAAITLRTAPSPYRKRLLFRSGLAGLAVVALILFAAAVPQALTALRRTVFPWAQVTYTTIRVQPGNAEVPIGSDQEIVASFSGRNTQNHILYWRTNETGPWQSKELTHTEHTNWSAALPGLPNDTHYRVAGGDALSEEFTIHAYAPPEIRALKIRVTPPAYTHSDPVEQSSPDITVLRGSAVEYFLTASPNTTAAQLIFTNGPTIALSKQNNDRWNVNLMPTNSSLYQIVLWDRAGHKNLNQQPHQLVVLRDEPPTVTVADPGGDVRSDPTNSIPLKISASDDYGISEMKLSFHKIGSPEQTMVCSGTVSTNGRDANATVAIDLGQLHLSDYEVVAYHAEATDNNTIDGPGVGKSPVYFIENTSKEKPLSQSNGGGSSEKINLLEFEKQIIADTSKAGDDARDAAKLQDLAGAQRQTREYAKVFQKSYVLTQSPPEAATEFAAAIESMDGAAQALDNQKRGPALKSEEEALGHLYQVARLLPEFESQCRGGNCKKIVLEAIEKMAKDQKKETLEKLPAAIAKAREIAAQQQKLNEHYMAARPQAETPSAEAKGSAQRPGEPSRQAKDGGQEEKNGKRDGERNQPGDSGKMAENQKALANQTEELGQKLRELSDKNPQLGHRHSENLQSTAGNMSAAADDVNRGKTLAAIGHGQDSLHGMTKTIAALERFLESELHPAGDIAGEEYPREFETLISDYYRKLSYEQ